MHDFDNNSMLDGLEILQAISHILPVTEVEDSVDLTQKNTEEASTGNKIALSSGGIPVENQKSLLELELKRAELIKQRQEDFDYYTGKIWKTFSLFCILSSVICLN